MDLSYGEAYERFRTDVKAFLDASWPLQGDEAKLPRAEQEVAFRRRAIERGSLCRYRQLTRDVRGESAGVIQMTNKLIGNNIADDVSRGLGLPRDAAANQSSGKS